MIKMTKRQNLNAKDIIKDIEKYNSELKRLDVKKIGLFGSYIKGKQHKSSDLDFIVKFKNPTFDKYMELKFLLERIFHKKSDLVMEDNLKPGLEYVKREAVYAKGF